jgi:type VI secretion system secreted protein VgrG
VKIEIEIPSFPGHGLSVRAVDIVEGLSMPFEVALATHSPDADLDFERLIGAEASLRFASGALGARAFSGVVSFVEQVEVEPAGLSTYTLRIVPRLWLLSQRRSHRIFQHQTALEMARALLAEWKIEVTTLVTEENLARHEVRVQYGETDLELLDRLLEEAGVSYFFDDQRGDGASHLVLADSPERAETRRAAVTFTSEPSPTWELPFVADVRVAHQVKTGLVTIADYDFRRPQYPLLYRAESPGPGEARLERFSYAPGAALADVPAASIAATDTPVADDQSHARADEHQGYGLAERRLQALREDRRRVELATSLVDLAPGAIFTIAGAPRPEISEDQRLLVTQTRIDGRIDQPWSVRVVAAFAAAKVRPPRRVSWPRIDGIQSAVVVGPEGQDIHADEFGRVRVRFHWDREGVYDDHRSAWVRVGDGWAGSGFGMIAVPRVGQEVLVAFYEGNPDQPLIVGRVHDGSNPVSHGLPAAMAHSVWRTSSSPKSAGYNELSFDDTAGRERVSLRAERDLTKLVVREEKEHIGGDRVSVIGAHLGTTVGVEDTITVGSMHELRMARITNLHAAGMGQPDLEPLDTRREIIAKRITLTTGGATIVLDGPNITVTAQREVRIKAGGTVTIQGQPYVQINPPMITRKADAALPPAPSDHVVWFRLVSEGRPLAGANVHLEHADGTTSPRHVTDGAGHVRLPVDKAGAYHVKIGDPPAPAHAPTAKVVAPAAPAPTPAAKAAAPAAHAPAAKAAAPAPAPVAGGAAPAAHPAIVVGQTPAQATAKAKATDHQVPIAIEVLSPVAASKFSIEPGTFPGPDPSMPSVKLEARVLVQGKETSVGVVRWELTITGSYRVRDPAGAHGYRMQEFRFAAGTAETKPNEAKTMQLAPAEIVGGDLEIKATFVGGPELANITVTRVVTGYKVVGKNVARSAVEAMIVDKGGDLSWLFLRMFCHESNHALAQFKNEAVLYGPPSGVGIVQRDPTAEEWRWPTNRITTPNNLFPRIFWDWKKNVIEGISTFQSDYMNRGRRDLAKLRTNNPELPAAPIGVLIRASIRRYNGGVEFTSDGTHYVVDPQTPAARVGYVDEVLGDQHGSQAASHPVPADALARIWPAPAPPQRR